ncbi:putative glycerol-1-phosphate prenyltransferase [Pustulibacterium marinum]|uniref:Geranylgeranylglyceryl phosphate synthase n=1 Tax=Pustulibacterium marinum TaxID=1224947 RepID=A0A1I7EWQ1_9FLAO|nr:geranylgeranylglyceryl/heptaprenylglyceryl phosphate synthase [Pustulibacterium marinum]SFU28315.1 putative glycerol-1-phosphate prenyltransferase [Pustulibacterium marinum]
MIYETIIEAKRKGESLISVLMDPDKIQLEGVADFIQKINETVISHILVGGSTVPEGITEPLVIEIKKHTQKPVVLFPGDVSQLTNAADGLLFLNLLSGRNPEYLIEQQIASASFLRSSSLEIMSTGYILVDGGKETATMKVTHTQPIVASEIQLIKDTAKAGELMGNRLIYLETGSGAQFPVPSTVVKAIKDDLQIPVIVGGGIRCKTQILEAKKSGAAMIVIGTAFEEDADFYNELKNI